MSIYPNKAKVVTLLPIFAGIAGVCALAGTASMAQPTAGDPVKGKQTFARCAICHSTAADTNKIGPTLHNIVGRKSGSIATFDYSPAMAGAKLSWTPDTLDKYLTSPKALVPGNKMIFAGLPKPEDRANVIAYLANPDAVK